MNTILEQSSDIQLDDIKWAVLLHNLKTKKLVPFLGAGASLGFNDAVGLPTGSELAKILALECGYPGEDTSDLLRVAQYYALTMGETLLRNSVAEKLSPLNVQPGEVHKILASWPIEVVLTTNYDRLMERALVNAGKDPFCIMYDRRGNKQPIQTNPTIDKPLIYKLHGSLEPKESMVITEDNMIEFVISLLGGNPGVPDKIRSLFSMCSILFIGYGLKDWSIRVLLRYFREGQADIRSFAIQKSSPDALWDSMVAYWEHQKVYIYNCDALQFLRNLDRRYRDGTSQ